LGGKINKPGHGRGLKRKDIRGTRAVKKGKQGKGKTAKKEHFPTSEHGPGE